MAPGIPGLPGLAAASRQHGAFSQQPPHIAGLALSIKGWRKAAVEYLGGKAGIKPTHVQGHQLLTRRPAHPTCWAKVGRQSALLGALPGTKMSLAEGSWSVLPQNLPKGRTGAQGEEIRPSGGRNHASCCPAFMA